MEATAIGIIGAGTLGRALALCLKAYGCNIAVVTSHSAVSAEALSELVEGCRWTRSPQETADAADIVFITTPDSAIAQVAGQVRWSPRHGVVHCSGAHYPGCPAGRVPTGRLRWFFSSIPDLRPCGDPPRMLSRGSAGQGSLSKA